MLRFLGVALALLCGSCSYSDFISATSAEKGDAYQAHGGDWKLEGTPGYYGRVRSVQVYQGDHVRLSENTLSITGGMGMASVISPDGYALTAAHVIDRKRRLDTILFEDESESPVHVQWATLTFTDRAGRVKSRSRSLQLVSYGGGQPLVIGPAVEARQLRVVETFPNRDLALVKLPFEPSRWFEVAEPPQEGTVLFAAGNSATPYAGPSAGKVVRVTRKKHSIKTIHTSAPLSSGDSGGPVFDEKGRLVGIVSHIWMSPGVPLPKLNRSSLRMIDPERLNELIVRDRARFGD